MKTEDLSKFDNEKFTNALKGIMGGDVAQPTGSLPQQNIDLDIADIEPTSFTERDEKGNEKIGDDGKPITHPWIRVTFTQGGALSLSSLLRCPEYTWDKCGANYVDRVKALATEKHKFRYQEPKKSRYGRDYKVLHMEPKEF